MVVSGQIHPPTPLNPYRMSLETNFMGTRATPDVVKDREVSDNRRGSNLDSSFVQPHRVERGKRGQRWACARHEGVWGIGAVDGGKWSASYPGHFTPWE
jgi:hypothetical protein